MHSKIIRNKIKKASWSIMAATISIFLVLTALLGSPDAARADEMEWTGVIDSRPQNSTSGEWVIGGTTFTADAATEFGYEHGPLEVGACADVSYIVNDGVNQATEIESQESMECDGDGDDDDHMQVYGRIDSFPNDLIGDWIVDGVTYTADSATTFEQEDGTFAVDACVEVKYTAVDGTRQALEIEGEYDYKCEGDGDSYSETKGVLNDYPADLIGEWMVDNITYTADAATHFEQDDGPFFVGACVEVKYTASDRRAVEIETDDGDCGNDNSPGESKLYGLIDIVPTDYYSGAWTIAGQEFIPTAATEFDDEDGPFVPGACAEVEYYDDNGVFIAASIEITEPYHCNNGGAYTNEVYGRIDSFPANLYGTWIVDGVAYTAAVDVTEFDQEAGPFAIGACVQIKYYTADGLNQAIEIESEDGDDCGEDGGNESYNKLYAIIGDFPPAPYTGPWTLGGAVYTATAVTEFEQENGPFAVGACVEAKYQTPGKSLTEVGTEEAYKCQNQNGDDENTAYGVVEQLPPAPAYLGHWQVSGVSYLADTNTIFEEEHGFFSVGAYVEVKYVLSGTTRLAAKIETHVAPNSGLQNVYGTLENYDPNDEWAGWTVDGLVYQADPAINVGLGEKAPQIGERIRLNTYQTPNGPYVTYAERLVLDQAIYLPLATR